MSICSIQRRMFLPAIGVLLVGGSVLAGCKPNAELSSKEVEQIKQGPPKAMPAQARKMFEQASHAGKGNQARPASP